jgi:hypothetical protein
MKRLLALAGLVLVAVTVGTLSSRHSTAAAPMRTARVIVSPDRGTQYQTFGFTGEGLTPGELVQPSFISPDGDTFEFHVLVVGTDGTFYIQVRPVDDFSGESFGVWAAHFETENGAAATVTFTVTRYNLDQPSG